ncbi:hypothetical protein TIFTF001_016090 [Ficus carica]|uniref:Uncharacterized protein n=1 Tax=Ficus carica TaxID=3494 RepID=A0AA88D8G0_FICCA|nr:hypothetical protein TIFTF001_016090 [Ficus carica]
MASRRSLSSDDGCMSSVEFQQSRSRGGCRIVLGTANSDVGDLAGASELWVPIFYMLELLWVTSGDGG